MKMQVYFSFILSGSMPRSLIALQGHQGGRGQTLRHSNLPPYTFWHQGDHYFAHRSLPAEENSPKKDIQTFEPSPSVEKK